MKQTPEQKLAQVRYLELCRTASIGGSLQPGLIVEAGKAAGYSCEIAIQGSGQASWSVNTLLADAIYNDRLRLGDSKARTVFIDSTEFLAGPWYEALAAIESWKRIVKPNWFGWEENEEQPSADKRLDEFIVNIPTTYAGMEVVELRMLIEQVGWNTDVLRVMPPGVVPQDEKDTTSPLDAFEVLALCEHGAKVLDSNTIELPCPQEGAKYRFAEKGFVKIIKALNQRADNLKIPW